MEKNTNDNNNINVSSDTNNPDENKQGKNECPKGNKQVNNIVQRAISELNKWFYKLSSYIMSRKARRKRIKVLRKNGGKLNTSHGSDKPLAEPTLVSGNDATLNEKQAAPYAIIYRSELDYISRCILDYKDIETGGQLFGFWTTEGVPVVLYVIGPGPKANHQVAFFVQDLDYLASVGKKIVANYGLQHIGEWHSHHKLGLASPSGHDASTIVKAMINYKKRRCLLCIGNCDNYSSTINAFNFHESDLNSYVHAAWEIKNIESPFRRIIDNGLGQEIIHPRTSFARHGAIKLYRNDEQITSAPNHSQDATGYWFDDKSNHIVLKHMIDYLETLHSCKPSVKQDTNGLIHLAIRQYNGVCIYIKFPQEFPAIAPEIRIEDKLGQNIYLKQQPLWQYDGNIFNSFKQYYTQSFTSKSYD